MNGQVDDREDVVGVLDSLTKVNAIVNYVYRVNDVLRFLPIAGPATLLHDNCLDEE